MISHDGHCPGTAGCAATPQRQPRAAGIDPDRVGSITPFSCSRLMRSATLAPTGDRTRQLAVRRAHPSSSADLHVAASRSTFQFEGVSRKLLASGK